METITLRDFDEALSLLLITDLGNAPELKKLALSGETNVVFVNPDMIVDVFHVLVAVHKGLFNYKKGAMITKSLQSEILFSLSSSKNISSTFKKFGIGESQKNILLIEVHLPGKSTIPNLLEIIKGTETPLTELTKMNHTDEIKKAFGIKEKELTCSTLSDCVVTRIASREFI